jgi:hypothetical protein
MTTMHFQLDHEDERRWVLVLHQLELTRIAVLVRGVA